MFLQEAEAKKILGGFGIALPRGGVADNGIAAGGVAAMLAADKLVVKALIRAGGRGLAGGIKFAKGAAEAGAATDALIGETLVTAQTGPKGEQVRSVYIEEALHFDASLYLSLLIDQRNARPTLMASIAGGVDFEDKARDAPQLVQKYALEPDGAHNPAALAAFLGNVGVGEAHVAAVCDVIGALVKAYFDTDARLIEINPLALMDDGSAVAIDAKMVLDDNALFRHPEFEALSHNLHLDPSELIAQRNEINFVKMDGDIGLVTNGAGLGLATYDMVVEGGGAPANFMDIRTTATSFQIARGIGLLIEDPAVNVLLVNIHGGGMTACDLVVGSLGFAYQRSERKPPIVFRVAGHNADWARRMIDKKDLPHQHATSMSDAVTLAVKLSKGAV